MAFKHTLLSLATFAAAGMLATTYATATNTAKNTDQAVSSAAASKAQTKPAKQYLFLISSGKAKLKKLSNDTYQLTMRLPSIDQVVTFTDRPYRDAQFISAKTLQSLWSKGSDSFTKDHPNAVLSSDALWPTIIEVDGVKTSGDLIVLQFKPLSQTIPNLTDLHKVTLTIDSAKVAASSTVTFGGLPK